MHFAGKRGSLHPCVPWASIGVVLGCLTGTREGSSAPASAVWARPGQVGGAGSAGQPAWQEGDHQEGLLPASPPHRKHTSFIQPPAPGEGVACRGTRSRARPSQLPLLHIQPGCYNQAAPTRQLPENANSALQRDECVAPGHTGVPAVGAGVPAASESQGRGWQAWRRSWDSSVTAGVSGRPALRHMAPLWLVSSALSSLLLHS